MNVRVICGPRHPDRWVERSSAELGLTIAGNGGYQVRPWCDECGRYATGSVLVDSVKAAGIALTDLQVVNDFRGFLGRCSVQGCEHEAVEDHHFAPRAIFGEDADYWPRALLCVGHHVEWHRRMAGAA